MKRNHLQLAPRLFQKLSAMQLLIYTAVGICLTVSVFFGTFFYFNLGSIEKVIAASRDYISHDNQKGLWKDPSIWDREPWKAITPQMGTYWTMDLNGTVSYIPTNETDKFVCNNGSTLNIIDTLIIKGDVLFSGGAQINVLPSGVLIILGNLKTSGGSQLKNKGRIVITENLNTDGGAQIKNTATGDNGFYLFGTKEMTGGSNYGKDHQNETQLAAKDNPLYLYVQGLQNELLPITLISFIAYQEENTVKLAWSTASEINNDFFTLERSLDGKDWEVIKRLPGAGNSNKKLDYQFEDRAPLQGYNYYRLKQTDFNGDFEYFKIVGVNFDHQKFEGQDSFLNAKDLQVGPNPFKESVTITYTATSPNPVAIVIRNITGAIVHKETLVPSTGENQYTFDRASQLKPGVYIINMVRGGKTETVKAIKI